jgi:hypothetical protein
MQNYSLSCSELERIGTTTKLSKLSSVSRQCQRLPPISAASAGGKIVIPNAM